jgi:hypothetical protein
MTATARKPARSTSPDRRARAHVLAERGPAWRAGLAGTALVHVALLFGVFLMPDSILELDELAETPAEGRVFEIEIRDLLPDLVAAPVEPPRFVEVNPAAPDNPPDESVFVGAQNQQVAQPEPTPDGKSNTPAVEGEAGQNATAIVRGLSVEPQASSLSEMLAQAMRPTEPAEAAPTEAERAAERPPARAVNAPEGGEPILGESDGGVGATVTRVPPVPGAESGAEARPGAATGRVGEGGYFAGTPRIDRSRPRERPRLAASTVQARNTPTIKNEFGTKNVGLTAYNAKWSAYGEYMQRLIDAVQAQWERLLLRSSIYPVSGSKVRVVFKLDQSGAVSEIVEVDGSGGELAKRLCVSAIAERAPYGEWTPDMIAVLGREQELTFTFHYQ